MSERIVILGAGIAGISACERILREAPGTQVVMLTEERDLPYSRPLLSKLALSTFIRDRISLHTEDWYRENGVRLLRGAAADRILPKQKEILLGDGSSLSYDKCIYALGAGCYIPAIPGTGLPGVVSVRSINDLLKIRRLLAVSKHAVVIGGGAIGLEFAWEIRRTGCDVTILETLPHLMGRVLDPESADVLKERCIACGLSAHTGVTVSRIEGTDHAETVLLSDGRSFPADLVLLSCGIRANTAVAERSGLACGRGVFVDDELRTSAPDVYAAGDCIQLDQSALHDTEGRCRIDDINPGLWTYARKSGDIAGFNAVHPADEALCFASDPEPVLLSALGTALFAVGNVSGDGCERVVCDRQKAPGPEPLFQVNPHAEKAFRYEKRFYREGRLCGAVLIGDLSRMAEVQKEVLSS